MSSLTDDLDRALRRLPSERARELEKLIRDALALAQQVSAGETGQWPEGYFEATSGALAGGRFERPPQGDFPARDAW